MKRIMPICLVFLLCALSAGAQAQIVLSEIAEGNNRLVLFEAQADVIDTKPGEAPAADPVLSAINAQIGIRFEQEKAITAMSRAGAELVQQGTLYQDGKVASMGRVWHGEQADGMDGSSAAGLTVSLETGMEIYLDEILTDYDAAIAEMERIISDEILDSMSMYLEYAELLPMPQGSYSFDETGLTIYYPDDLYRYYSGEAGSVTFYWHEIADYIGEGSPAYALAHPDVTVNPGLIESACAAGELGSVVSVALGDPLGHAAQAWPLGDPDYTTDALVYPLERVRGYAVEIPRYAETDEEATPVSAVRASSISLCGLITTGKTTETDALQLLGEPLEERVFDEDSAFDAMLDPGKSLYFGIGAHVLQLHFDESGVLACVILRQSIPESLY